MNTKNLNEFLQIPEQYRDLLELVDGAPYAWAELPLADHPGMPNFNRKVVITGFNSPDLSDSDDLRLYITVRQILTNKSTGKMFRSLSAPAWEILADTWSYFRDPQNPTKPLKAFKIGEDGKATTDTGLVRVTTIKYLKFLLFNREAHLVDLFETYLKDFVEAKRAELDNLM